MSTIENGYYLAKAKESKIESSLFNGRDRVFYVKIVFEVTSEKNKGFLAEWKGSLSLGSTRRTAQVLNICGARMREYDPTDLNGIYSNEVEIELVTIECFESPGSYRTFVNDVRKPMRLSEKHDRISE